MCSLFSLASRYVEWANGNQRYHNTRFSLAEFISGSFKSVRAMEWPHDCPPVKSVAMPIISSIDLQSPRQDADVACLEPWTEFLRIETTKKV